VIAFLVSVPLLVPLRGEAKRSTSGGGVPVQDLARRLDAFPDHYIEIAQKFEDQQLKDIAPAVDEANRNSPLRPAVFPPDVQWTKRTVTVAFSGGSAAADGLIEQTAKEWISPTSKLTLSFRNENGSFRTWTSSDQTRSADIRIAFDRGGYWSLLGRMANAAEPHEKTMNLEGLATDIDRFAAHRATPAWLTSYYHFVILHEFGHALGLAHEHFHRACQNDLKLSADPGYSLTRNRVGEFVPDVRGRSPGAILYFKGAPNKWSETKARFNLDASSYFYYTLNRIVHQFDLEVRPSVYETAKVDRRSVMLYAFHDYLFQHGAASPCKNQGEGQLGNGEHFATRLSNLDQRYFEKYYGRTAALE
jgi:hypothetical protein